MRRPNYDSCEMSIKKRKKVALIGAWGYGNIGDDTYPKRWREMLPDVDFELFNSDIPENLPDADLYLFGGGGIIYDNGSAHVKYMGRYIEHAIRKDIPLGFASVGVQCRRGQGGWRETEAILKWVHALKRAEFITVRDHSSQRILEENDIAAALYPDLCYLTPGLGPSEDYFVTIIPACGCSPHFDAFHQKLAEVKKAHPECPLIVMNMGGPEGDKWVNDICRDHPVMASYKTDTLTTEISAEVIRCSKYVMTGRYHGLIFSHAARKNYWLPKQGRTMKIEMENLEAHLPDAAKSVETVAKFLGVEPKIEIPKNLL